MNAQIQAIYKSRRVTGKSGVEVALHSEIDPAEGAFIHQVIAQDATISKTLEVGCAYGLASLHICDALGTRSNPQHIIVDPFQYSEWDGVGVRNLEEAGIDFFRLIEKRSEFALPELLGLGESTFDLIFIDGWHTLDHTLLDCFYATRLLKTGGYLLIDDTSMAPVGRATDYISRYPCYQVHAALSDPLPGSLTRTAARAILGLVPVSRRKQIVHPALLSRIFGGTLTRMFAFKKIAEDERSWDWFPDGF